jgi:hypothetical protein
MDTVDADSGFRDRWYAEILRKILARPFVHILFGARVRQNPQLCGGRPRDGALAADGEIPLSIA